MMDLARLNLHLADDVLTINADYLQSLRLERSQNDQLSFGQICFKAAFWQERRFFPDQGYLLEKAVLGRAIQSLSLLNQEGQLRFYDFPCDWLEAGVNNCQTAGLLADGSLLIQLGDQP